MVSTETVTDRPGSSRSFTAAGGRSRKRTGTRWTILVKLPVAFSGGSRANCAPVPGAKLSTTASIRSPPSASTFTVAAWPTRMRPTCVSLKLATR